MDVIADLPRLDEHETFVAAGAHDVWEALLETVDHAGSRRGAAGYARAVGCADRRAAGPRPLAEGSTIAGFRVVTAAAPSELVLQGRHRFSSYALIIRLDEQPTGTRLRAETRAVFPGVPGRAYRLLILRTGGHVLGMRRLLSRVRDRAERQL